MIRLDSHPVGTFGAPLVVNDDGRTVLVATDWDYPGVASTFGWWIGYVPAGDGAALVTAVGTFRACPSEHDGTDGTIRCDACGAEPSTFIDAARDWIDAHDGATADDPGYFNVD